MQLVPVNSSQIALVGYDPESEALHINFRRSKEVYCYGNVPPSLHHRLMTAPSIGEMFGKHIKPFPSAFPFFKYPLDSLDPATQAAEQYGSPSLGRIANERRVELDFEVTIEGETVTDNGQVNEVAERSTSLAAQAKEVVVDDIPSQERASQMLLSIAQMRGQLQTTFKPMKDAAHKAHKIICDQEKTLDLPLLEAERSLKAQISGFIADQRIAAEQELRRQQAEEKARAEAEAEAESSRLAIEDAIALEAEGRTDEAEAVLANPLPITPRYIAPAAVAPRIAQVAGVSARQKWTYRITNEALIPREFLQPNERAISSVVQGMQGKTRIPGIEVYSENIIAASRRSA